MNFLEHMVAPFDAQAHATTTPVSTLLIIDPSVENYQHLMQGVINNAHVCILDAHRDGVQQITQIMQRVATEGSSILQLHLITHGAPGTLYLGNSELSLATLSHYASELQTWFAPNAELLLYGCNVAAGDAGAEFLEKLHRLTGAKIAASTTPIGHGALGGNWDLDYQIGQPNRQPVLTAHTRQTYQGVLAATNLTNLPAGRTIFDFELVNLDSGGPTIIYLANQLQDSRYDLFTIPVSGGTSTKSSDTETTRAGVTVDFIGTKNATTANPTVDDYTPFYELAKNGTVTFVGLASNAVNATDFDLFGVPPNAKPNILKGSATSFNSFKVSENGLSVLFAEGTNLLFSPIAGNLTTEIQINPAGTVIPGTGTATLPFYQFGASDSHTVVLARDGVKEDLYSIPTTVTTTAQAIAQRKQLDNVTTDDIEDFKLTPDKTKVVYRSNQNDGTGFDLYVTATNGSVANNATAITAFGTNLSVTENYKLTDTHVVYVADGTTDTVNELYSIPFTGNPTFGTTKLNKVNLAGSQAVKDFEISPTGNTIVYIADQETPGIDELYSVPIDGSTDPVKLNTQLANGFGDITTGADQTSFVFSPDGSTIVYQADQDTNDIEGLYSVPAAGGTAPKALIATEVVTDSVISQFEITSDNKTLVYLIDKDGTGAQQPELYSVPVDGSTGPTKLNGNLVAGSSGVRKFEIASDGTVIYNADEKIAGTFDLFTATIPQPPTTITASFETTSQSGAEGGGDLTIKVMLSQAATAEVEIPFTLSGTATEGATADYTVSASPLKIAAGAMDASITVTPLTDTATDADETVIVTLGGPADAAAVLGTDKVHTITITDVPPGTAPPVNVPPGATPLLSGSIGDGTLGGDALGTEVVAGRRRRPTEIDQPSRRNTFRGSNGNDEIIGGRLDERFIGRAGNDLIEAGKGDDFLNGGPGDNELLGERGEDRLVAKKPGSNILVGGRDDDDLTLGRGKDMVVFENLKRDGTDTIKRFDPAEDVILFERKIFRGFAGSDDKLQQIKSFVLLETVGSDTEVKVGQQGQNTETLAILVDVAKADLTAANFIAV